MFVYMLLRDQECDSLFVSIFELGLQMYVHVSLKRLRMGDRFAGVL